MDSMRGYPVDAERRRQTARRLREWRTLTVRPRVDAFVRRVARSRAGAPYG